MPACGSITPAAGVKAPRERQSAEDFKYLGDDQLARLLAAVPDPEQASGREKLKRLTEPAAAGDDGPARPAHDRGAPASVEDVTERGDNLALLVRGKTGDRLVYLRLDTAERLRACLAIRGEVQRDEAGTPLFAALGNHRGGHRLTRRHIRSQVDGCLIQAGLKRPGLSNHALHHTAATLGYLPCARCGSRSATPTRA